MTEQEELELMELMQLDVASRLMDEFVTFTFPQYEPSWHHRAICKVLDKFVHTNELNRLMIFAPPRHGKSELVSRRLPAFIFGHNPDAKIIACSYSADLSSMMNRDVQRIIDSEEYKILFPYIKLNESNVRTSGNYLRNSDIFEVVGRRGAYRSAGVGGGITGQGADVLIIDDPLKNQEEADSSTIREKIWNWYTTTAYTRLEKNGKVIIMMTRWHEDDLAGRLLKQSRENPQSDQWTVVTLPAVLESEKERHPVDPRKIGESLWPAKYSMDRVQAIKASVGQRAWSALFQQTPTSEKGGVLKRQNWQFYDAPPARFDTVIQSWDLAFKGNETSDYIAGQVWGKVGANIYLLDYFKQQLGFADTLKAIRTMCSKWPNVRAKLIEDKANGPAVQDSLKNEIHGILMVDPQGGKVSRVNAIAPVHEAGNIWLPRADKYPWVGEFVETCAAFPNVKHDDDVDAMSQALLYLTGDPAQKLERLLKM